MSSLNDVRDDYVERFYALEKQWAAWPPCTTDVALGSIFQVNGCDVGGPKGNINDYGCEDLMGLVPVGGLSHAGCTADKMNVKYFGVNGDGSETEITEEGEFKQYLSGRATYQAQDRFGYYLAFDDIQEYRLKGTGELVDTADILTTEVWPRIVKHGGWQQHWWVVVGEVFTAKKYVRGVGTESDTQFTISATGGAMFDLLSGGSISADITVAQDRSCSWTDASYNAEPPFTVGYVLYHFDPNGVASVYAAPS